MILLKDTVKIIQVQITIKNRLYLIQTREKIQEKPLDSQEK